MIDDIALLRLNHELGIWRRAWQAPILWWRDDDCREPSWQLDRLLHVRKDLPVTLAVIPDGNLAALATRLETAEGVTVAQHGVDHENKLPAGGPRSEFPEDMSQDAINAAVAAGHARLSAAGLAPLLFVPPWNEPSDRQVKAIKATRYRAFSIGKNGDSRDGLEHVGAQVDILRWKGKPRFRGRRRIFDALRYELEERRRVGAFDKPIGLLTHHLVHDEAAWKFLTWFATYATRGFDIRSLDDLVQPSQSEATPLFKARRPRTSA